MSVQSPRCFSRAVREERVVVSQPVEGKEKHLSTLCVDGSRCGKASQTCFQMHSHLQIASPGRLNRAMRAIVTRLTRSETCYAAGGLRRTATPSTSRISSWDPNIMERTPARYCQPGRPISTFQSRRQVRSASESGQELHGAAIAAVAAETAGHVWTGSFSS
jgi:hypothetical protein